MKALIQKLVETHSPSGYESDIRSTIRAEVESYADEIRVDALGNLIIRKGAGSPEGKKIMLAAHMDEIGVIVTHVVDNGFVRFSSLGGVRPVNCLGGRVRFLNGAAGVIGSERIEDASRVPSLEQLFIDLGLTQGSGSRVRVGDVAVFERPFLDLGKRLVSKAMDDRIGVAVMIETLRQVTPGYPANPGRRIVPGCGRSRFRSGGRSRSHRRCDHGASVRFDDGAHDPRPGGRSAR